MTNSAPVINIKFTKRSQDRDTAEKDGICTRCGGRNHQSKDCDYNDARCHKCNKQGHFAKMCRTKKMSTTTPLSRCVRQTKLVEETLNSDSDNFIFQLHKSSKLFTVDFCIDRITLNFEVDIRRDCCDSNF